MTTLRLGAVSFLNAKPLTYAFESGLAKARFVISSAVPSVVGQQLESGDLDIALAPAITLARNDKFVVVGDAAITSSGAVGSVFLVSRQALSDIRTIAVDTSSRSSVALLRIVLRERHHVTPEFVPHPPAVEPMLERCDAALLIGDAALQAAERDWPTLLDLGREWEQLTRLPFVYACWIARDGRTADAEVAMALNEARDIGVAHLDDVVSAFGDDLPVPRDRALRYLRDDLGYRLGSRERAGLRLFLNLAATHGVIPSPAGLTFCDA